MSKPITYRVDRRYANRGVSANKRWDNFAVGITDKTEAIDMALHTILQDGDYYDWAVVTVEAEPIRLTLFFNKERVTDYVHFNHLVFQCGNTAHY